MVTQKSITRGKSRLTLFCLLLTFTHIPVIFFSQMLPDYPSYILLGPNVRFLHFVFVLLLQGRTLPLGRGRKGLIATVNPLCLLGQIYEHCGLQSNIFLEEVCGHDFVHVHRIFVIFLGRVSNCSLPRALLSSLSHVSKKSLSTSTSL